MKELSEAFGKCKHFWNLSGKKASIHAILALRRVARTLDFASILARMVLCIRSGLPLSAERGDARDARVGGVRD